MLAARRGSKGFSRKKNGEWSPKAEHSWSMEKKRKGRRSGKEGFFGENKAGRKVRLRGKKREICHGSCQGEKRVDVEEKRGEELRALGKW